MSDDHPILEALDISLKALAMMLALFVVLEMSWQDALGLPPQMCVEAPLSPQITPPVEGQP